MTASFADSRPEHETMPTHKWLVAASVMLGAILTNLDASIVNVALPYMQKSFGGGVERITWVVTSYLVAVTGMLPAARRPAPPSGARTCPRQPGGPVWYCTGQCRPCRVA